VDAQSVAAPSEPTPEKPNPERKDAGAARPDTADTTDGTRPRVDARRADEPTAPGGSEHPKTETPKPRTTDSGPKTAPPKPQADADDPPASAAPAADGGPPGKRNGAGAPNPPASISDGTDSADSAQVPSGDAPSPRPDRLAAGDRTGTG
jgi:hypothetical protein